MLAIRQGNGWSQQALAQQLDVSERTIRRWEKQEQEPPSFLMPALRELAANLAASVAVPN